MEQIYLSYVTICYFPPKRLVAFGIFICLTFRMVSLLLVNKEHSDSCFRECCWQFVDWFGCFVLMTCCTQENVARSLQTVGQNLLSVKKGVWSPAVQKWNGVSFFSCSHCTHTPPPPHTHITSVFVCPCRRWVIVNGPSDFFCSHTSHAAEAKLWQWSCLGVVHISWLCWRGIQRRTACHPFCKCWKWVLTNWL